MNNIFKTFTTIHDKNIAFHVTNNKKEVIDNQKSLCKKYNLKYKNLKYMNQIHGNDVQIVNKNKNYYECDALITNLKDTPLMVMVADCIPILFYDEKKAIISVAHAGRNGTFLDISSKVIYTMKENFSCDIKDIKVDLGPGIAKCCYEVSEDLATIASNKFSSKFVQHRYIDLQGINKKQLLSSGVLEKNITISDICTKCSNKPYFSYRKDKACGRFAGIIMIR